MKLEVGMYVRTKNLGIEKIINVFDKNHLMNICGRIQTKNYGLDEEDILKASNNIIDLLEIGDYVNGDRVTETMIKMRDEQGIFGLPDVWNMYIEEIKIISIVTKEQFESMSYEVN